MPRMKAAMAAVLVMEKEGISQAFGVGRAINPALRQTSERGTIGHAGAPRRGRRTWPRGTPAAAGNIGVHWHLGPGRHRHGHRPVRGQCRSIPILCITGRRRAPSWEDFQAVDIDDRIAAGDQMGDDGARAGQVPRAFQQAFHLMRSGRPGPVLIDLPFDVQMAEIEFDIDTC